MAKSGANEKKKAEEGKPTDGGLDQAAQSGGNQERKAEKSASPLERKYVLNSERHRGGRVCGSAGIIEFDGDGNALVDAAEARRFASIPGYTVRER